MTQINTVRAVPYAQVKERVEAAAAAHDAALDKGLVEGLVAAAATLVADKKKEVPYEKRLSKMSMRQLRGEVKRAEQGSGLPKQPRDDSKKGPWVGGRKIVADTAFAVILKVLLDSHERGMNPFPR